MKRKQDISNYFQDNQYRLDERPPERTWERLESRLDAHQRKRRQLRPRFRVLGMAASLLFLVAMMALVSMLFRSSERAHEMAHAEAMAVPVMEELKSDEDRKGVYTLAVSYQRYLNQSPSRSIAEGPEHKKLLSPGENQRDRGNNIASNAIARAEETPQLDQDANKHIYSKRADGAKAKKPVASESSPSSPATAGAMAPLPDSVYKEREVIISHADVPAPPVEESMAAEELAYEEAEDRAPAAGRNAGDVNQYDAVTNAMTYSADGEVTAGIEQFQWLIGQWKEPLGANRQNLEYWEQTDAFTIAGSGQLVVNGDTTFTEGMKIQKIGENLYFILAVDQNNQKVKFRLRSYLPEMAVFEADEPGLPNQVILQQHSLNNFSTTIQNAAPSPLNQNQLQYLQFRNNVELNQRTTRNMSRINE